MKDVPVRGRMVLVVVAGVPVCKRVVSMAMTDTSIQEARVSMVVTVMPTSGEIVTGRSHRVVSKGAEGGRGCNTDGMLIFCW